MPGQFKRVWLDRIFIRQIRETNVRFLCALRKFSRSAESMRAVTSSGQPGWIVHAGGFFTQRREAAKTRRIGGVGQTLARPTSFAALEWPHGLEELKTRNNHTSGATYTLASLRLGVFAAWRLCVKITCRSTVHSIRPPCRLTVFRLWLRLRRAVLSVVAFLSDRKTTSSDERSSPCHGFGNFC